MITHIVLFKLKEKNKENMEKAKDVLMSMKGKIAELQHNEVGTDVVRSERSFDIALVTKFNNLEDLNSYQINPIHVEVSQYMISIREVSVTVDYES